MQKLRTVWSNDWLSSQKSEQGYKLVKTLFGKYEKIPEEWEVKRLGSLGEPIIGLTYEPKNVKSKGVLVLRSPNIQDSQLRFEDNVFVDVKIDDRLKIKKGDLLICTRNGSKRLIGKCAYIDDNYKNMTFGTFMSVFRSPYNQFIFHQFQTSLIRKQITKSTTATINQITNQNLNSYLVLVPPLEEQNKIAIILSSLDDLIKNYDLVIDSTVKLKKGLMQQLITKGIGHKKFKKSTLGSIPEDWEIVKLKDIATTYRDPMFYNIKYVSDGIPVLNIGNIDNKNWKLSTNSNKYQKINKETSKKFAKTIVELNDIVLAVRGATIGKFAIVPKELVHSNINANLLKIHLNAKICNPFFFWFYAQTHVGKKEFRQFVSFTAKDTVQAGELKFMKIILPSVTEQQKIISILSCVDNKILDLEYRKTNLEKIKKGLMQKLLTGQIRVKI